jgi:hypothetical protein
MILLTQPFRLLAPGLSLLAALLSLPAEGRTVQWSNETGDDIFQSDGVTPIGGAFNFELGTFGSFDPAVSDPSLWVANWKPLDMAGVNLSEGFFSGQFEMLDDPYPASGPSGFVSSSYGTDFDGLPPLPDDDYFAAASGDYEYFDQGEVAYVWVYNSQLVADGTEWALFTAQAWTIPAPNSNLSDLEWRLTNASTSIWGAINDDASVGEGIRGAVPADPENDGWALQTFGVVPEPGSFCLLAGAWFLASLRRHRI